MKKISSHSRCAEGPILNDVGVVCDICGKRLRESEVYDDRFHTVLCLECLCALHKI